MNIVVAPDSFKESLSALEVANAIVEGFQAVYPNATYHKVPMADGGEGTVQSIADATKGRVKKLTVKGPLLEPVEAFYGLSGDNKLAVIEMAAASGLELVPTQARNPLKTSTWGVGELILDALSENVTEITLGIGGSATNDGGLGMVMALGGRFLDKDGQTISPDGEGLAKLAQIDLSGMPEALRDIEIKVACDVTNPLTGPQGASYIYGPQKGGTPEQIAQLDANLAHYAAMIQATLGKEVDGIPGAGAAGGLGAGLLAFLDAELVKGGELIAELLNLEEIISTADLVITGEGGINHQTVFGKTPIVVSSIAEAKQIPVIGIAGVLIDDYHGVFDAGMDAVFSIIPSICDEAEALANGYENVKDTARNIAAVFKMGNRINKQSTAAQEASR